jgi:hypothetical protein
MPDTSSLFLQMQSLGNAIAMDLCSPSTAPSTPLMASDPFDLSALLARVRENSPKEEALTPLLPTPPPAPTNALPVLSAPYAVPVKSTPTMMKAPPQVPAMYMSMPHTQPPMVIMAQQPPPPGPAGMQQQQQRWTMLPPNMMQQNMMHQQPYIVVVQQAPMMPQMMYGQTGAHPQMAYAMPRPIMVPTTQFQGRSF